MKRATIFFLAVFALATGASARDDYSINKISTNFIQTPQINFTPNTVGNPTPQVWLTVEVAFSSNVDFTDELEFKYFVYMDDKCTSGSVTHVNIPKGFALYSVMYESPGTMLRPGKNGQVTRPSKNVTEVTVQILAKGQVVAEKSMKGTPTGWWAKIDQDKGSLLNKNQTPFSSVYWDRYLEIKPAAQ